MHCTGLLNASTSLMDISCEQATGTVLMVRDDRAIPYYDFMFVAMVFLFIIMADKWRLFFGWIWLLDDTGLDKKK